MSDMEQAEQHIEETEMTLLPSRSFRGFDWSEHVNVKMLIDALFRVYAVWYKAQGIGRRIRDPDRIRQHLTHFVLEAYRTHRARPELSMGVHLGKNYYADTGSRYRPRHLSYRMVRNVTDFLVSAGHLEMPAGKGVWHPDVLQRRTTRYRATRRLIDRCQDCGINRYMIVPFRNPEVIILRDRKKRKQSQGDTIDYVDTPFTRTARRNLERINDFISGHMINLDLTDDQEEALMLRLRGRDDGYIDHTKTRLVRIFNNGSFQEGGRLYGGWWQGIPGDYRTLLTINGKRIVQLDYSGMHFSIMYAQLGMDTPMEDPYALEGYDAGLRGHIKKAFNIIINCNTRAQAIGTINGRIKNGKLSSELLSGERLIQAFIETHPLIRDKIASGEGVRGQFVDSQVAERILLKGMKIGLCILPIHDGFITTRGDEFVLEKLMNDSFEEVTGHSARLKPESFDLSVLPECVIDGPHWITRPDGSIERDTPREGKAVSYSQIVSGTSLWRIIEEGTQKKRNRVMRDEEWKTAHVG